MRSPTQSTAGIVDEIEVGRALETRVRIAVQVDDLAEADGPRAALEKLRKAIKTAAPGAIETISYQMPAFRMHGQGLVSYAAFKHHCSLFAGRAVIEALGHELEPYLSGKSTIRFQADTPLAAALVKKIVKVRLGEIEPAARPQGDR